MEILLILCLAIAAIGLVLAAFLTFRKKCPVCGGPVRQDGYEEMSRVYECDRCGCRWSELNL